MYWNIVINDFTRNCVALFDPIVHFGLYMYVLTSVNQAASRLLTFACRLVMIVV